MTAATFESVATADDVETLVGDLNRTRASLVAERAHHVARVREIDALLDRLSPPQAHLSPVATEFDSWDARASRLHSAALGRDGVPLNARDVVHACAVFYGYRVSDLTGQSRHKSVAQARHVAMFLARKLTKASFPELGAAFGSRDHTTVFAGVDKVAQLYADDAGVRREVDEIEKALLAKDASATATGRNRVPANGG